VISDFMIQGGGFDASKRQKPTEAPIVNEFRNGLKNLRGTISMARLGGQPNSATTQFFINVDDNDGTKRYNLDRPQDDGAGYAVFGRVIHGMDAVDTIRNAPGANSVPQNPAVIEKVTRLSAEDAKKYLEPSDKTEAPKADPKTDPKPEDKKPEPKK
jgi:cyclophilin family peptidyl-prolyl cis-trans isomerase